MPISQNSHVLLSTLPPTLILTAPVLALIVCLDEGNSSSRKTRQQVAYAQSLLWQTELAQVEEEMRFDWPPLRQGPTLQLVSQVQEESWSGHWQNAHIETFGKKGKERIQRRMHCPSFGQEEEQIRLKSELANCRRISGGSTPSADETTRMSTKEGEERSVLH